MEVFLKRAEIPFKDKIGAQKATVYFEELKKALHLLPGEFSGSVGSEIPKLLFKYSEGIQKMPNNVIEAILNHFIIFTKSLNDLSNQPIKQINQTIMNRSKSEMRNLSELLNKFIEKAKNGELMENQASFENIISFMTGESVKATQFGELELFIKRSSDNFIQKIEKSKVDKYSNELFEVLKGVAEDLKGTIDSEIVKFLFKLSQDIHRLTPEKIENILDNAIKFTKSLSDLKGKNKSQVDQEIIRRSKNQVKGLMDLFKSVVQTAKEGKPIESAKDFDSMITSILGLEEKRKQFIDVGGFLKRVEDKYVKMLGETKAKALINDLLEALSEIPEQYGHYLASDISRHLTKYSETMINLEPKDIENTLTRTLMFTRSLKELINLNNEEINQFIINRSKSKIRNLFDLYNKFLEIIRPIPIKSRNPTFDEIVEYTLGKYESPKVIEETSNVHNLMEPYHKEFPIAQEHAKWANAVNTILTRYIEILKNNEGDQILNQIWSNSFPKNKVNEEFQGKIEELPRDDEKLFMFRLMNLLTRQVLKNQNSDRDLTGSVSHVMLNKILLEIYSGRNPIIRAIKITQLLKEREFKDSEKKQSIDEQINNIIKEDLNTIKKRTMLIRSITPILTMKGYYIQTYDINRKKFPELFVDMFADVSPIENIGKEFLKTQKRLNTLGNVNALYYYIENVKKFNKYYFKEAETVPLDAVKKRETLTALFKMLTDLYDNLELSKFYDNHIIESDRLIYIYLMKYLYEPLKKMFDLVEEFLSENEDFIKVKSMDYYLSNLKFKECKTTIEQLQEEIKNAVAEGCTDDTEKMNRLKNMLDLQMSDLSKFHFMDDLFNNSKDVIPKLDSRILFGKELFTLLNIIKDVNRNLSAIFPQYLQNLKEFDKEIDKVLVEVDKLKVKKLISPGESYDINKAAEISKERISNLVLNTNFLEHVKGMIDIYDKVVLYSEQIEKPVSQEIGSEVGESSEPIEEINPLEKYFKMYNEELTAVSSTNSLIKFMDAFNLWLKDELLPLTYNKPEELLIRMIFRKIKKKYLNEDISSPSSPEK